MIYIQTGRRVEEEMATENEYAVLHPNESRLFQDDSTPRILWC